MAGDSSDSPEQSPSSDSPPPPSPDSSSDSPPPPSPDSSPPPSSGSSPPPPSDSGSSSPSPPPPDSSGGGSSSSPSPPPPSEVSSSPPPPAAVSNSPPPPAEQWVSPAPPGERPPDLPPPAAVQPFVNQSSPLANASSSLTPIEPSSSSSSSSGSHTAIIAGLVAVGGCLILMVVICVLCSRRKKRKQVGGMPPYGWDSAPSKNPQGYWQSTQDPMKMPSTTGGWGYTGGNESGGPYSGGPPMDSTLAPSPSLTLGFNKSTFTYEELSSATNGFDKSQVLGQGGFGFVHKGVLPNGKEIAVKSLKAGSGQGEREFQAEVEIISRVHHRHLVSLVGYCIAQGQRMLVYEFVPNDTLEYHLHKKDPPLDFPSRVRIALGSAKGLGYLHEDCHPRIIHRDIKASNILLDENMEGMVADFGLAKLTNDTSTHVSTRVMGTFGYLAPEYASSGKLTEKSDVFSYGVMLLELITGRRPVDPNMKYMEDSLVDWSRPLLAKSLETGNYDELADPRLERDYNPQEMQRMVACAAASIRHSAKRRPKMSQIVRALEGDVSLDDLNDGPKAGHFGSSDGGSDYDTRAYSADIKKFRQMAFATQDFASSEYGATTSEYGLNPSSTSSDNSMNTGKMRTKF